MPGLVPGIHVFLLLGYINKEDVDGRDKPGHDGELLHSQVPSAFQKYTRPPAGRAGGRG
jgi:hypothetical protein